MVKVYTLDADTDELSMINVLQTPTEADGYCSDYAGRYEVEVKAIADGSIVVAHYIGGHPNGPANMLLNGNKFVEQPALEPLAMIDTEAVNA